MSELHILNVGRADCSIFLLDTEQGKKTVVLDGGELSYLGRQPLLEFLKAHGITTVDLMILTHLHQDHFGGFHQLIDQIQIKEVVAPCGDLEFHKRVYEIFGDQEFFREYHLVFQYLQRIGTKIHTSIACSGKSFTFGDNTLRCIYPFKNTPMHSVACAKALCRHDMEEQEIQELLEMYKQACNEDSSIWVLSKKDTTVALMTGDSTDQTLQSALNNYSVVGPIVQKLSNHGINSLYFSAETQKIISPHILVVSVDKAHYNSDMQRLVDTLGQAGNTQIIHFTFQGDFTYHF